MEHETNTRDDNVIPMRGSGDFNPKVHLAAEQIEIRRKEGNARRAEFFNLPHSSDGAGGPHGEEAQPTPDEALQDNVVPIRHESNDKLSGH
ncbi:MAG: hypothetical protein ACMG55_13690 [Microcoleus sp.]